MNLDMDLIKVSRPWPRFLSGPGSIRLDYDLLNRGERLALMEAFEPVDHGSATIENYTYWCPLLISEGKLDEALKISQRVIRAYDQVLGFKHPSTVRVQSRLGYNFERQGKLDEALEIQQRALRTSKKVLGLEHCSTIEILRI